MSFPEQCVCHSAGKCKATGRVMTEGMLAECQTNAGFRQRLATLNVPTDQKAIETNKQKSKTNLARYNLPCIYRSKEAVRRPSCGCEVYGCTIHKECVKFKRPLVMTPMPKFCDECNERVAPAIDKPAITDATICITHWLRPDALDRLMKSIEQYLPGVPILLDDTQGNVSASRNRLAAKCPTKYYIMFEDDFIVRHDTAKGLVSAIAILDHDATIAGVGGTCIHQHKKRSWGHNFVRQGSKTDIRFSNRPKRSTPSGLTYLPCDLVLNFGVFRRDLFEAVPWDEKFEITEHQEYFWRASRVHFEFAYYAPLLINHWHDPGPKEYRKARNRRLNSVVKQKHGFTFKRSV